MKKLFIFFIVILLLISGISCTQKATGGVSSSITEFGDIKNVKITTDQANVQEGCSPNSNVLQTLDKNSKCDVLGKVEDWYAVKLDDNSIGFVPQDQCKPIVVEDQKGNGAGAPTPAETPTPQTTPMEVGPDNDTQDTTPKIPTENTNSASLTNDEQQMLDLVNQARAQNNLPALKVDMELTNVARIKSQDMIDNNYFSHNSPTYGSPFDMMKDFGINYVQAGENIAGNQSVQNAHDSLMNSPGHRKNILSPDFTHIGIGIKNGGSYGKMFTQMFISKPK